MENFATVTANPKTGNVFTPNADLGRDGKQYGYIRVESMSSSLTGFARVNKRSALIPMEDVTFDLLKGQLKSGARVAGKIVFLDSLTPESGYRAMEITDRKTGEIKTITCSGKQVYRKTLFTEDLTAHDIKLAYDKVAVVAPVAVAVQLTEVAPVDEVVAPLEEVVQLA